jgi:hypothetical protein
VQLCIIHAHIYQASASAVDQVWRVPLSGEVSSNEGMTAQWQHMQRQFHLPFPLYNYGCRPAHSLITLTSLTSLAPCCVLLQELLDLLKLDPTDHMWYCLFCEETIPSAPLRYGISCSAAGMWRRLQPFVLAV